MRDLIKVCLGIDGVSSPTLRWKITEQKRKTTRTLTVVLGGACFSLSDSLLVKPLGLGGEVEAAADVRAIAERSTSG